MDTKKIVASGYDNIAAAYLKWISGSSLRERWLTELAGLLPERGRVLDLGCGAGVPVIPHLKTLGFSVTGIDGSSAQIELARKNAPYAELHVTDMASASFPAAGFEAVTAFYSITHLPRSEHSGMFGRIYEWLKPGGLFLATLGFRDCPEWTGEWLGTTMFFSHFDAETNIALLQNAGFKIKRREVIGEEENQEIVKFLWVIAEKS